MSLYLLLFLLFDAFVMGVLASLAFRHARAHIWPHKHDGEHHQSTAQTGHLPPAVREQMLAAAQANFQSVLDHSAAEMQHDLKETVEEIKKTLNKQGTETVSKELERYHAKLIELQQQAEGQVGSLGTELAGHQAALKAKMAEEIAAEKQQLVQQIDTKLADAVASFLMETLQHNVDLGAQSAYLTAQLEAHKADFSKGVADEAQA
jgi:hypothetical protein